MNQTERTREELVTVATFGSAGEAELARSRLLCEGIAALLVGEHEVAAARGVRLQVRPEAGDRAAEILGRTAPLRDLELVDQGSRSPAAGQDPGEEDLTAPGGWMLEERVTVATFLTPWEAQLARARLLAEGIPASVADEHLVRMDWFIASAIGGVKLQVGTKDAHRAAEALDRAAPLPEISLVTEGYQPVAGPRCPGCRSANLDPDRSWRWIFLGSWLLLGFPLLIPTLKRWRCARCGSSWRRGELAE